MLTAAMEPYLGKESQLGKALNPEPTEGLIAQIKQSGNALFTSQQEWVWNEISLTNSNGILSTLVAALRPPTAKLQSQSKNL